MSGCQEILTGCGLSNDGETQTKVVECKGYMLTGIADHPEDALKARHATMAEG